MNERRLKIIKFSEGYCARQRPVIALMNILFFFTMLIPFSSSAELLDGFVASVNNDVITLRELNQATGFNSALGGGSGDMLRAETLEGIINRRLLVRDAYRFKFAEVSGQEVESEIGKLKIKLGSDAAFEEFLMHLDMSVAELGRMLSEQLLVERFIEKKIQLFIRVGRDEVRDYFNKHPDRFAGKTFQEVQKAIISELQQRKLEQQMTQYLEDLRNKADVRVRL